MLIVNGHPNAPSLRSVAKFVAEQAGMLEVFFPAAPFIGAEPDKYVWNDLKSQCTGREVINSLTQLCQMIVSRVRQLQKLPM